MEQKAYVGYTVVELVMSEVVGSYRKDQHRLHARVRATVLQNEENIHIHFKQMVRSICMIVSVRSSHSPPFPLTIPPIPEAPAPITSLPSSMRSALVHVTIIGTPPILCVSVPGPKGRTAPGSVELAGRGSDEGSV